MEKYDNWFYSIFERDDAKADGCGKHLGSVSLRHMDEGPELLPPLPEVLRGAEEPGKGDVLADAEVRKREADLENKTLTLRVLGYALFEHAQGRGVATEACQGLLDGYAAAIGEWRASPEGRGDGGKTLFYVEGGVDVENPGSQRVLGKVGFRTVGMKMQEERAWLNGGWRGPGWWITGRYL
jgi:RimJ/RimL family protein N-acetyltransferase